MKLINLLFYVFVMFPFFGMSEGLLNGPMLGHITEQTAHIWLQTEKPASVSILYHPSDATGAIKEQICLQETKLSEANTCTLVLTGLQPNTQYTYQVAIDGEMPGNQLFYFTTAPISLSARYVEFSIAFGSCNYVNDSGIVQRGGDYQIFDAIAAQKPRMMFWLGDNVYTHPGDWSSKEALQRRYTHTRKLPEMQNLLSTCSHYAIWDDHDYGPNDSDRSFYLKHESREVFKEFWANPAYGLNREEGITAAFSYADVDFFLLDNRTYRSPQKRTTGTRTVLGQEQLEWLIDALSFSEANFKVVVLGNLFLSDSHNPRNQNYISNYDDERKYIISEIEKNNIKNVIFLTGDKHFAELTALPLSPGDTLYEFTSSPLTAVPNTRADNNTLRVAGTHFQKRNFGIVRFTSSNNQRQVAFELRNSTGEIVWEKRILMQSS